MVSLGNGTSVTINNPGLSQVSLGSWPGTQVPQSLLPPLESYSIVPGMELGFQTRAFTFTTTNTTAGSTAGAAVISGLSVTVVGNGRPVKIDFIAPNCYHSVANSFITAYTIVNGVALGADAQLGEVASTSTTAGETLAYWDRLVLTNGVSYTFTIGISGSAAGTTTLSAAGFAKINLLVTQL